MTRGRLGRPCNIPQKWRASNDSPLSPTPQWACHQSSTTFICATCSRRIGRIRSERAAENGKASKSASFGVLEDLANCARHRRHPGGRKFDLIAAFALSSPRLLSTIDRSTMKKTRGLSISEESEEG